MLEIDTHHRLVKHIGIGDNCWMGLKLTSNITCYKRAVWEPATGLLDEDQAATWLANAQASAEIMQAFMDYNQQTAS